MNTSHLLLILLASIFIAINITVEAQSPPASPNTNPGATSPVPASTPRNKPCTAAAHRQFDFWIGDWDVTDPAGKPVGTNLIKPILGGCVLHESWVATGGTFTGQSYNTFDASRDVWHQTWVDMSGTLLLLKAESKTARWSCVTKMLPAKKTRTPGTRLRGLPMQMGRSSRYGVPPPMVAKPGKLHLMEST